MEVGTVVVQRDRFDETVSLFASWLCWVLIIDRRHLFIYEWHLVISPPGRSIVFLR